MAAIYQQGHHFLDTQTQLSQSGDLVLKEFTRTRGAKLEQNQACSFIGTSVKPFSGFKLYTQLEDYWHHCSVHLTVCVRVWKSLIRISLFVIEIYFIPEESWNILLSLQIDIDIVGG